MSEAHGSGEIPQAAAGPRLLVELPSWPRVFFGNLRDSLLPRRLAALELESAPAPFWADVFVLRRLPWKRFVESCGYHAVAIALLIAVTRFFALQPQVVAKPVFDHAQVIYYKASEYLPPIDTRSERSARPSRPDPELARQPIISVPPEPDNRSQTLVAPPNVKLKRDVAVPNIVAWSDKVEKPRLAIPPVPLTPAAEITRIAPEMEASVVRPPPDASRLTHRQDAPTLAEFGGGAAAGCRECMGASDRRSEYRTEFGDRAGAATAGRGTAYPDWIARVRRWSASSGPAPVGFRGSLRGVIWGARPRHCTEPASRSGRAARSAVREPARRFRRNA